MALVHLLVRIFGLQIWKCEPHGSVKVYIETPDDEGGFCNATCWLPDFRWENVNGYTDEEMQRWNKLIRDNAHLIIEFSQEGGILNATAV